MTKPFSPPPHVPVAMHREDVEVPEPLTQKEPVKAHPLMRALRVVMAVAMIGMVGFMVYAGMRGFSPMMIMMGGGMVIGMLSMALGTNGDADPMAEVNIDRKNYYLALRTAREVAVRLSAAVHAWHRQNHPNPQSLVAAAGKDDMWAIDEKTPDADLEPPPGETPPPSPYMSARIGVGPTRLYPQLIPPKLQIPENTEPVTGGACHRFLRTQNLVVNCPMSVSLLKSDFHAVVGQDDDVLDLGRAMIASIAHNHSPDVVPFGIVTNDEEEWDWAKWLPHLARPSSGLPRGHTSLEALAAAEPDLFAGGRRALVVVDVPGETPRVPAALGNGSATVLILRCAQEHATDPFDRFHVSRDGRVRVLHRPAPGEDPRLVQLADADRLSREEARAFARKMAPYRHVRTAPSAVPADGGAKASAPPRTLVTALGVENLDDWDPRDGWRKALGAEDADKRLSLEVPIGNEWDGERYSGALVTLDISQIASGGTGPHGVFQGKTGSGKSVFGGSFILMLAAHFSPEQLQFILGDFKGGATIRGMDALPHTVATISDLENDAPLVARMGEVVKGEIARRKEFLAEHGVQDIRDYRTLRRGRPELPPLADLLVFVDEFGEFNSMYKGLGYLDFFGSIGRVGRSIGVHAVPGSQVIDFTVLGELSKHLGFGISLRVDTDGESRSVLHGLANARQLKGTGDAYLRKSVEGDDKVFRFRSFYADAPYRPPAPVGAQSRSRAASSGDSPVRPFTLLRRDDEKHADLPAAPEAAREGQARIETGMTERDALIARIAQFDQFRAPKLWHAPIDTPISYADVDSPEHDPDGLVFQIGETDAPFQHARLPYSLRPEDRGAHTMVVGGPRSGKSTAVQAMVLSSAMRYPSDLVSWLLIGYSGSKLHDVAQSPNVSGYADRVDDDEIRRYVGECLRVLALRERLFAARGCSSFSQYLERRAQDPVPDDPYGHLFLAVDGLQQMKLDHEGLVKETLPRIAGASSVYGVHLVVTISNHMEIPTAMQGKFGGHVQLRVTQPSQDLPPMPGESAKQRAKTLPAAIPGRCVDVDRGLDARILLPIAEKIEPESVGPDGRGRYKENVDRSHDVQALAARLRAAVAPEHRAPELRPVPAQVPWADVWSKYARTADVSRRPGRRFDARLPLGLDISDSSVVTLPEERSPHLVIGGDPQSGRTTALRSLIRSVVAQYSPEQARFFLVDPDYALADEREILDKLGYLERAAYSVETFPALVDRVEAMIRPRVPTEDQMMRFGRQQREERTWYDGPEVYVVMDQANLALAQQNVAAQERLGKLAVRRDLGLHLYLTLLPGSLVALSAMNKLVYPILSSNAPVLLLSGDPKAGVVTNVAGKFQVRRPGQGLLVLPAGSPGDGSRVVQLASCASIITNRD